MTKPQTLTIASDGTITAIYSDDLVGLLTAGESNIRRASSVEPYPGGGWTADLSPVSGPFLGPFPLRETALQAEVEWLTGRLSSL
jgi:hypothetical protein